MQLRSMHVNIVTQSDEPEVIQLSLRSELSLHIITRAELSPSDHWGCLAEVFLKKKVQFLQIVISNTEKFRKREELRRGRTFRF